MGASGFAAQDQRVVGWRFGSSIVAAVPFLLLAGCTAFTIDRPRDEPLVDPPRAFHEAERGRHAKIATGWLADFHDPQMTALVREAVRRNHNLQAAAHRLRAAGEGTIIGRAARLPSISAGASASETYAGLGPAPGVSSQSYGLSLNAAWEIDLWGRLRDLEAASYADYEATLADFRSARLSLAVNTAKAWANLIEAQQQFALARQTLEDFKTSLRLIERQYRAAILRAVDVQLGRNNVAAAERNLRSRILQRDEAARTLQLLLGRYPSGELQAAADLPALKPQVPVGLPAGLLARRPDLAAGRARIFSSARTADAARKDLLPSIRLTGAGNTSSELLHRAIDPGFITWSVAAALSQTVYRGGAPSAEARAALARNRAAISDYVQAVLTAFREVESALQTDRSLGEQERFLLQEVKQATLAQKQSERDLGLGIPGASVLEILEAQRRAVNARGALIRLRNQRIQNRLDLYLALGGNFETN